MATLTLLFHTLIILSLFSFTSSLPSSSITDAAEILSNSGFLAMSLTLNLVSKSLTTPFLTSLTIFSPSDQTFSLSGQPSLSLLNFHFAPRVLSLESLKTLPFGTKIPTLNPNQSLTVTTPPNGENVEINGIKIVGSPIYDDGLLAIFGIDKFFDPRFQISAPGPGPSRDLPCRNDNFTVSLLNEPCRLLRSGGYSVMASFLGMQFLGFDFDVKNRSHFTVFAPDDGAMVGKMGNLSEHPSILLRHVVPCKIRGKDLVSFENGTTLRTGLEGFMMEVTNSGGVLMVNGVLVKNLDMYQSGWLTVHGIWDMIPAAPETKTTEQPGPGNGIPS